MEGESRSELGAGAGGGRGGGEKRNRKIEDQMTGVSGEKKRRRRTKSEEEGHRRQGRNGLQPEAPYGRTWGTW
eukprot:765576-Hanusia_phi.AAC.5